MKMLMLDSLVAEAIRDEGSRCAHSQTSHEPLPLC